MAYTEIKAAFRIFYREKSYALINISGLTLAVVCCLILGLYLRSELTYEHHNEKIKYWKKVYSTDENVFDIFTHEIIYGDPKTALTDPTSVAISETFAKYYFGDVNPLAFLLSILIVLGLAFLTIAAQSNKTARKNPSTMLHYE